MRRTLYLVPSKDSAIYCRGSARRAEKEVRWMLNYGASAGELERALAVLLGLLDQPRSRQELARLLGARLHVRVESRMGGTGWGSLSRTPWIRLAGVRIPIAYALHVVGARGVICSGPTRGTEGTYVRADAWSTSWREVSQIEAEGQLLRRYLQSFGPARLDDFAVWTGMTLTDAEEIWSQESGSLARVNVAGEAAWVLRKDLDELLTASLPEPSLRLLPHFDSYLLGHRDHGSIVERAHHPRVFRSQGWVSPTLLLDGRAAGVWSFTSKGRRLRVRIEPFVRLSREVESLAEAESQSLARFLGYEEAEVRTV